MKEPLLRPFVSTAKTMQSGIHCPKPRNYEERSYSRRRRDAFTT